MGKNWRFNKESIEKWRLDKERENKQRFKKKHLPVSAEENFYNFPSNRRLSLK
ncbi:MAG: hypothetical protein KJ957_08505 [Candidatus Omnitrophica bacterium]|nr:hypothetical protein [Candidatus Omnitrophota bacterium]